LVIYTSVGKFKDLAVSVGRLLLYTSPPERGHGTPLGRERVASTLRKCNK